MKASKFSEAQIAFVLKQAGDGSAVGEVCRKAGISEATFYNWRKKYAGLMPVIRPAILALAQFWCSLDYSAPISRA
jgi:putative transposase